MAGVVCEETRDSWLGGVRVSWGCERVGTDRIMFWQLTGPNLLDH